MNKRKVLYENIMNCISREIKNTLNESDYNQATINHARKTLLDAANSDEYSKYKIEITDTEVMRLLNAINDGDSPKQTVTDILNEIKSEKLQEMMWYNMFDELDNYELNNVELTEEDAEKVFDYMEEGMTEEDAICFVLSEIRKILDDGIEDELEDEDILDDEDDFDDEYND